MTNDQTSKAVLEKVRELREICEQSDGRWLIFHEEKMKILDLFPSIASLVEEQAKRIEELEYAMEWFIDRYKKVGSVDNKVAFDYFSSHFTPKP